MIAAQRQCFLMHHALLQPPASSDTKTFLKQHKLRVLLLTLLIAPRFLHMTVGEFHGRFASIISTRKSFSFFLRWCMNLTEVVVFIHLVLTMLHQPV